MLIFVVLKRELQPGMILGSWSTQLATTITKRVKTPISWHVKDPRSAYFSCNIFLILSSISSLKSEFEISRSAFFFQNLQREKKEAIWGKLQELIQLFDHTFHSNMKNQNS
jgi:hypothetical protein